MSEIILAVTCIAILCCWVVTMREREKGFSIERELWHTERQQLLDRIQAPTFDNYKHHEVKMTKAQQPSKEEEPKFEYV